MNIDLLQNPDNFNFINSVDPTQVKIVDDGDFEWLKYFDENWKLSLRMKRYKDTYKPISMEKGEFSDSEILLKGSQMLYDGDKSKTINYNLAEIGNFVRGDIESPTQLKTGLFSKDLKLLQGMFFNISDGTKKFNQLNNLVPLDNGYFKGVVEKTLDERWSSYSQNARNKIKSVLGNVRYSGIFNKNGMQLLGKMSYTNIDKVIRVVDVVETADGDFQGKVAKLTEDAHLDRYLKSLSFSDEISFVGTFDSQFIYLTEGVRSYFEINRRPQFIGLPPVKTYVELSGKFKNADLVDGTKNLYTENGEHLKTTEQFENSKSINKRKANKLTEAERIDFTRKISPMLETFELRRGKDF